MMRHIQLEINNNTDWSVAGDKFRPITDTKYNIRSLFRKDEERMTTLCLRRINGKDNICLYIKKELVIIPSIFSGYLHTNIQSDIPIPNEQYVVDEFNNRMDKYMEEYNGLFAAINISYPCRRITRTQAFSLIEQILKEYDETHTK